MMCTILDRNEKKNLNGKKFISNIKIKSQKMLLTQFGIINLGKV